MVTLISMSMYQDQSHKYAGSLHLINNVRTITPGAAPLTAQRVPKHAD